jgi:hypothetical protein
MWVYGLVGPFVARIGGDRERLGSQNDRDQHAVARYADLPPVLV